MPNSVSLARPLSWRQVAAVAEGAPLSLTDAAEQRIRRARLLVESIVDKGIRAYGVNTGVGALCDVIVEPSQLRHLSRNIVMSHAVGVGTPLGRCEVRAIITAAVNNFAHGHSGVRLDVVDRLLGHLRQDWIPEVPASGSVGYLSHMAHIALALIGEGHVQRGLQRRATADVLEAADVEPLVLEAKEGLSLVNGTPCVTGLMSLALLRAERLLNWADVISAMSFENLHGQASAFDPAGLRLRASPEVLEVSERLLSLLDGSGILAANAGRRTQDALSLRAIPQVHGAAREVFARAAATVDTELRAVTDNPVVVGTEDEPRSISQANAVGAAIGLGADSLGVAMAELAAMAERRIDRLVNPLVSGLPAFLASDSGAGSGFMIAQYTAASLVAENRRLAAPASLDGGVTSGLQEDHLCHATPAALKLLKILDNAEFILSIELLATVQAYDLQSGGFSRAPNTDIVYRAVRGRVAHYRDERPLGQDIERVREIIREPTAVDFEAEFDIEAESDEVPRPTAARQHRAAPDKPRSEHQPRREQPRGEPARGAQPGQDQRPEEQVAPPAVKAASLEAASVEPASVQPARIAQTDVEAHSPARPSAEQQLADRQRTEQHRTDLRRARERAQMAAAEAEAASDDVAPAETSRPGAVERTEVEDADDHVADGQGPAVEVADTAPTTVAAKSRSPRRRSKSKSRKAAPPATSS